MIVLKLTSPQIIERQRGRLEENVGDMREKAVALELRGLF
jgi:hypothetical protein